MSDEDIDKGAVWFGEIYKALDASKFGVIALTAEKQDAPWVLFEAGALTKVSISRAYALC